VAEDAGGVGTGALAEAVALVETLGFGLLESSQLDSASATRIVAIVMMATAAAMGWVLGDFIVVLSQNA